MSHLSFDDGAVVVAVGSRVTCSPPPTDTDEDYLILVKDKEATVNALKSMGFEYSIDPEKVAEYEKLGETSDWSFTSLFFGNVNYIVTDKVFFFERFLTATHICKTLNLLKKEDRVMVHEAIRGVSFSSRVAGGWKPGYGDWITVKKVGGEISPKLNGKLAVFVRDSMTGEVPLDSF